MIMIYNSFQEWIKYIKNIHYKNIDLNIQRVLLVSKKLGLTNPAPFIILIGGTNGKGSSCKFLESILINSKKGIIGTYISPHIFKYKERVRIQGKELSYKDHVESFNFINQGRREITLSYFEFGTLAAFYLFKKYQVDILILEVGMGGKHDATNIVNADISIITNIGLDHTEFLGKSIEEISYEKSGIFRTSKPAIIGEKNITKSLYEEAKRKKCSLFVFKKDWWFQTKNNTWDWWNKNSSMKKLPIPKYFDVKNTAIILETIDFFPFKIKRKHILHALKSPNFFGRLQKIHDFPLIILDSAHNPHASLYLSKYIKKLPKKGKIYALVGMLKYKDISSTLKNLLKQIDFWYCVSLNNTSEGASSKKIYNALPKYINKKRFEDLPSAFYEILSRVNSNDSIIIFGSFYIVSGILSLLKKKKNKFISIKKKQYNFKIDLQ